MQRWRDSRKISKCDGGSGPGKYFRERLDDRDKGKEFFLLPNEPIILSAMSSLKSFSISSVVSNLSQTMKAFTHATSSKSKKRRR